jgi:membrane protein implicated in regulation of membrane protease activity
MILLRAVALILTAILVITGLILAVVALLATQWLAVATVAVVAMALVWAVVKGYRRDQCAFLVANAHQCPGGVRIDGRSDDSGRT